MKLPAVLANMIKQQAQNSGERVTQIVAKGRSQGIFLDFSEPDPSTNVRSIDSFAI